MTFAWRIFLAFGRAQEQYQQSGQPGPNRAERRGTARPKPAVDGRS